MVKLKYRIKQLLLLLGDVANFFIALYLALTIRFFFLPSFKTFLNHILVFCIIFGLWVVINYINNLYDLGQHSIKNYLYRRMAETSFISFVAGILFLYLFPPQDIQPKTILVLVVVISYILSTLWRLLYHHIFETKRLQTKILFVGYTKEVQNLIDILKNQPERGYSVKALIDPEKKVKSASLPGIDVYQGLHTIRPVITNHNINLVIIAQHLRENQDALRELYELLFWDVNIHDLPTFYEEITGRIPPSTFSEGWFLDHLRHTTHPIYDHGRIIIDYISSFILGIFFIISFPIIAVLIKTTSPGPLFYKQTRVGKGGRHFTMYKYRSMYALAPDGGAETDGVQFATKEDKRVTKVGKILRQIRLDELPQAWNLFRKDITLIGPRPERPEIVEELEARMPYYPLRHVVRPGLTSWAVIHQNYTDNLESSLQKLQYDLYYIKNRSFIMDISIILRTINVVFRMRGQ